MGQIDLILLESRIGHVKGTVNGMNTDQTGKNRAKRTAHDMLKVEKQDFLN